VLNKFLVPPKLIHIEIGLQSNFIDADMQSFFKLFASMWHMTLPKLVCQLH